MQVLVLRGKTHNRRFLPYVRSVNVGNHDYWTWVVVRTGRILRENETALRIIVGHRLCVDVNSGSEGEGLLAVLVVFSDDPLARCRVLAWTVRFFESFIRDFPLHACTGLLDLSWIHPGFRVTGEHRVMLMRLTRKLSSFLELSSRGIRSNLFWTSTHSGLARRTLMGRRPVSRLVSTIEVSRPPVPVSKACSRINRRSRGVRKSHDLYFPPLQNC